ncbi:porin family protein [Flavobacterium sp. DGU11]|uniref:Porin family protein n=1 Tax=Flavobacterium arundinis TaxID=3139143 RepID=A0ABU9HYR2_9FLAO
MKKIIFLLTALAGSFAMQAQGIDFGIKAGANFANFTGGDINTKSITSFHAGAVVELNIVPVFSVQAEALFSSQGATYKDTALNITKDINLKYVSVPVLAKFYVLPKLSVMAGPQFSFLVDDADEAFKSKKFDLAASGGVELKIIAGLFAQARYNIGLTKVNDDQVSGDVKNAVFQLSLGYFF